MQKEQTAQIKVVFGKTVILSLGLTVDVKFFYS